MSSMPDAFSDREQLEELAMYFADHLDENSMTYLKMRGIQEALIKQFEIGAEPVVIGFVSSRLSTGMMAGRVTIPIRNMDKKVVDVIGRAVDDRLPKYKSLTNYNSSLFGAQFLNDTETVVLTSGIFDALSLIQSNIPAVAVPDCFTFTENHAPYFANKQVFICLSNDEAGRRETVRIAQLLKPLSTHIFAVGLPPGVKDINDLFVHNENALLIFQNLLQQSVQSSLSNGQPADAHYSDAFLEEFGKRKRHAGSGLSTGLGALDQLLNGGLHAGLYVISSRLEGGKTALLRQLGDQLAVQGVPVIYFSYDTSAYHLWSMSIAQTLDLSMHEVLTGQADEEQVKAANATYKQLANKLWTVELTPESTISDVVMMIQQTMQKIDKAPCVILDPIERLYPDDSETKFNLDRSQRLEWALYQMHHIARQLGSVVLAAAYDNHIEETFDPTVTVADVHLFLAWEEDNQLVRSGKFVVRKNLFGEEGSCEMRMNKSSLHYYA